MCPSIEVRTMSDTMQMITIGILFVFILGYSFYVCRPSPSKKGFRAASQSVYRRGGKHVYDKPVWRENNPRFVKEGAEERIRHRMRK